MKIILHSGTGKTGTTSIQETLASNAEELYANDYFYPTLDASHSLPMQAMFHDTPAHLLYFAYRFKTLEEATSYAEQMKASLTKQLTECQQANFILSAESLGSFSVAELNVLRDFLLQYADEIEVVHFVRNPINWARSCLQMRVPFGSSPLDMSFLPEHHYVMPDKLIESFGADNIRFFRFEDALDSGSVVNYFWENVLDLSCPEGKEVHLNESLSGFAYKVHSLLNDVVEKTECGGTMGGKSKILNKVLGEMPGGSREIPLFFDTQLVAATNAYIQKLASFFGYLPYDLITPDDDVCSEKMALEQFDAESELKHFFQVLNDELIFRENRWKKQNS